MPNDKLLAELRSKIASIEGERCASPGGGQDRACEGPAGQRQEKKEPGDALRKIIALVNVSDRSVFTIRERLERAGFEPEEIQTAIGQALEYGLLDDERFARVLIQSRLAQGKGSAGIERELAAHEIDPSFLEGWPEEFMPDEPTELERAVQLLRAKPPRSKNQREGAFRKLVQNGYAVPIASSAARLYAEQGQASYR